MTYLLTERHETLARHICVQMKWKKAELGRYSSSQNEADHQRNDNIIQFQSPIKQNQSQKHDLVKTWCWLKDGVDGQHLLPLSTLRWLANLYGQYRSSPPILARYSPLFKWMMEYQSSHRQQNLNDYCLLSCFHLVRLVPKQSSSNHHHNHLHHGTSSSNSNQGGGGGTTSSKDLLTVNSNASIEMQLRSRRKAAKMLVVVVIVFAVCYFPVHLVSILRWQTDFFLSNYLPF